MTDAVGSAGDSGQMRLVGGVIAATMLLWFAANWAGRRFGWPDEYAFLADLAAIGALVWSLLVTWRLWRRRAPAAQIRPVSGAKERRVAGPKKR